MAKAKKKAIEMMAQAIAANRQAKDEQPKRKKTPPVMPTPERLRRQGSHRVPGTKGAKMVPVIETMLTRKQITDREFVVLDYYRQQASLAGRSPIKSCIDFSVTGGDMGPSAAITSATLETARIERDLGSLWQITRAVAVDDISLTEWCIKKHGGRERYNGKGKFIAMVPINEKSTVGTALMELKMAARRICK